MKTLLITDVPKQDNIMVALAVAGHALRTAFANIEEKHLLPWHCVQPCLCPQMLGEIEDAIASINHAATLRLEDLRKVSCG